MVLIHVTAVRFRLGLKKVRSHPRNWGFIPHGAAKENMDVTIRENIKPGQEVDIVLKKDQAAEKLTRGVVADILTNSPRHPHGIKVRLESGEVGRVKNIISRS